MTRFFYITILALLIPLVSVAQDWLQDEERTAQNPQVHKQDVLNRIKNSGNSYENAIQSVLRTPYVKPEYKVYDYAGVLSDNDIETLRRRINALIQENQLDAVVVFVSNPSWTDLDNESFCKDFYDYNDFGCGNKHSGVCLVNNIATRRFAIFDTGEPKDFLVAGSNLDKYEMEILQPYYRRNDYAGGVEAFLNEFENDFLYERDAMFYERPEYWIGFGIAVLLGLIITSVRAIRKCKIQKAVYATNYEVPNSFNLTIKRDTFVSSHTTKTYIPPSNSSSGGGGGSSHSGGSGGW